MMVFDVVHRRGRRPPSVVSYGFRKQGNMRLCVFLHRGFALGKLGAKIDSNVIVPIVEQKYSTACLLAVRVSNAVSVWTAQVQNGAGSNSNVGT